MTRDRFPIPDSRFPLALLAFAAACATSFRRAPLTEPMDQRFVLIAPDSFDVDMSTTKGPMVIRLRRNWAPIGVDRFYSLVPTS